jgi:hypothetical protein
MNPRTYRFALIFAAIGAVAFLVFLVLVGGCGSTLPEETGWVEVTARSRRD